MKKKSMIILTIVLVIIVVVSVFAINKSNNDTKNKDIKITVSVYNKENNQIYNKNIETEEKYLSGVLENNKDLEAKMEESEYGKYLTSLLGIEQGDNYYWSYYINDEYSNVGVSNCKIEQNKVYAFKIQKLEY